jgi:hypothetical protein
MSSLWIFSSCNESTTNDDEIIPTEGLVIEEYVFNGTRQRFCSVFGYEGIDTNINIPAMHDEMEVLWVNESAFLGNEIITSVTLNDVMIGIEDKAFSDCSNLETIDMSRSILSHIDKYAFSNCTKLKVVKFPEIKDQIDLYNYPGLTLREGAFSGCTELTEITLPQKISRIDKYVFAGCENLTTVNYLGTKAEWEAISKGGYKDLYDHGRTIYRNIFDEGKEMTIHCTDGDVIYSLN